MEFPILPFERMIKKAGAKRVSHDAAEEMAKTMEERIFDISKEAVAFAKHAGRKTIIVEDIRLAKRKFE